MEGEEALQGFVLLARSNKGKALAALIQQAIAAPNVWCFGELLDMPNIQELEGNAELKPYHALLRLFSHGTYADYKAHQAMFPALTPQLIYKLKLLTLVTLASEHKVLPYELLQQQLEIGNVRELEDLVIDAIYQGLVKGKLDQKCKHLEVHFAIGRDIRPGEVEKMMGTVERWLGTSEEMLRAIEERVRHIGAAAEANRKHKQELEASIEATKKTIKAATDEEGRGGMGMEADADYMDEDRRPHKTRSKQKHGVDSGRYERRR
eukprot:tig00001038_g6533.t1